MAATFQVWPSSPAACSICARDCSQQARLMALDASTRQPQPQRCINKAPVPPPAPEHRARHHPLSPSPGNLRARQFLSYLDWPDSWSCAGTARSYPLL